MTAVATLSPPRVSRCQGSWHIRGNIQIVSSREGRLDGA